MKDGIWLNDEAINFYMVLLQVRTRMHGGATSPPPRSPSSAHTQITHNRRCAIDNNVTLSPRRAHTSSAPTSTPSCMNAAGEGNIRWSQHHYRSKALIHSRSRYKYKNVMRWGRKKRLRNVGQSSPTLLDVDRIILPVNHGNTHWSCAMIDIQNKQIVSYDSLNVSTSVCAKGGGLQYERTPSGTHHAPQGRHDALLEHLARYVSDEARERDRTLDTSGWERVHSQQAPQQNNGCDCGVFTNM